MALFSFLGFNGGLSYQGIGPQGRCAYLALMTSNNSSLYFISDLGGTDSSSFLAGSCRSNGFQEIPDTDSERRALPLNWGRKSVSLEVPGGYYLRGWKQIKLTIRNTNVAQTLAFEWEGFMSINSGSAADFNGAGIAEPCPLTEQRNRRIHSMMIEGGQVTQIITGNILERL